MDKREIERQLKVLANHRRLAILHLLLKRKEADVTAVSETIRLSFTSTSKHLVMLERAGFIEKEQRSTNVYYRLSPIAPKITSSIFAMF
ncbi:hypothetical protein A2673_02405 [Candidatus Kaiserbacteria bacterium RIFCSPHIGHO2_01_FULL_50_13]|uniref:HTH arsR-type domain-containing protein n=1 Tax=Candidatus Kaiserbacteria bacterium RIFCSPLOWO2_01_FULL_50_24 TaxID=1798507 RepID=A0A1F6ERE0_9BACT|nr:MAG: hypothetical protein A2673_02405 [Candidatus Kaiserbacteria bacterium RIFCSPHIGHO2_01_FULL_50_13]OGG76022.1 MAG: hypothetical protein A3A34_00010 [Candidatus Kaiserbacteria bacterium RIFCSPLOWO2_01_FULL_50_24]OGG82029.1 MAG: hypothetical protein A3H74_03430 [Candidatus Kaiserbacteria bacterium RIFCSPLOWO2_02_FULL_51_13]